MKNLSNKVEEKGKKKIINFKITTLKKKQQISLLDEILGIGDSTGFSESGKPIIVVPAIPVRGGISIANTFDFLVKGKYVDPLEAEAKLNTEQKLNEKIEFEKEIAGKNIQFEVYNSVISFTKRHWKRVVAVFVHGEKWQFKDWPTKESMVDIFLKIKGYYITYHDVKPPAYIGKINVEQHTLDRTMRHGDQKLKDEIWNGLTNFMLKERYKG